MNLIQGRDDKMGSIHCGLAHLTLLNKLGWLGIFKPLSKWVQPNPFSKWVELDQSVVFYIHVFIFCEQILVFIVIPQDL